MGWLVSQPSALAGKSQAGAPLLGAPGAQNLVARDELTPCLNCGPLNSRVLALSTRDVPTWILLLHLISVTSVVVYLTLWARTRHLGDSGNDCEDYGAFSSAYGQLEPGFWLVPFSLPRQKDNALDPFPLHSNLSGSGFTGRSQPIERTSSSKTQEQAVRRQLPDSSKPNIINTQYSGGKSYHHKCRAPPRCELPSPTTSPAPTAASRRPANPHTLASSKRLLGRGRASV